MQVDVQSVFTKSWNEAALFDAQLLVRGLSELGLSATQIGKIESGLSDARQEAMATTRLNRYRDPRYRIYRDRGLTRGNSPFDTPTEEDLRAFESTFRGRHHKWDADHAGVYVDMLRDALKHLMGWLTLKVESTHTAERKVPLFMLHSPPTHGSEVLYQETLSDLDLASYELTVLGQGLGATSSVTFSVSHTLTSRDGAYKRVYVPVMLQTTVVGVYEEGVRTREFARLEYLPTKQQFAIGVEELTRDQFLEVVGSTSGERESFRLSGDPQGAIHTFKRALGATGKVSIKVGIEALNIKTTGTVELSRNKDVSLECKLPSGFDYEMRPVLGGLGVLWSDPAQV
jgi:hypothetical protein